MPLKSEFLSKLLKILLLPILVFKLVDFLSSIVISQSTDWFLTYINPFYGFLNVVASVANVIVIILFLIWIYRVHMDLNRLIVTYSRSPGMALACVMIPFFNFYGIPSNYFIMGNHFKEESIQLRKEGRWISGLAVPVILFSIIGNVLTRSLNADEANAMLMISASAFNLIVIGIYYALCHFVSNGLRKLQDIRGELDIPEDEQPVDEKELNAM